MESPIQSDREYRKIINAWSMYDWANSAFATTIMAAVYPIFYRSLATNAGRSPADATAYWAYTTSVSLLLVAIAGPILGAISDCMGRKKRFIGSFALIGIVGTAAMAWLGPSSFVLGSLLFFLGNIGFAGSNIFYEALLPHVAKPEDIDRVSTRGYALGYVGGGLLLVVNILWLTHPDWFAMPSRDFALRACFISVAVWWAAFSLPLLRRVPEPAVACPETNYFTAARSAFVRLGRTFLRIRRYRQLVLFLIAFWIYNDGIGTIIKMATAYGDEIGVNQNDMILALIITQFVGIPCAFAFGNLAGRFGARNCILAGLVVYLAITIFGFFMRTSAHFYTLAIMVGLVQGGTQALSRSLFAVMAPRSQAAEFFGFYSTGAKFAGIIGPTLFGAVGQYFDSSRMGILSVAVFFIVGGSLLLLVNVNEGKQVAADVDAEAAAVSPPPHFNENRPES